MASGRFLSTSIAEDDRLNSLSITSELLYLKTIPHLDRDGMIGGKPGYVWGRVCPLRDELIIQVQSAIDEWVATGLVVRFGSEAGPVLFFPGFLKNNRLPHYKREGPSRFPAPPGYVRTEKGLTVQVDANDDSPPKIQDELQEHVQDFIQNDSEKLLDEVLDFAVQKQEEVKDQKLEKEETHARDPVAVAWMQAYNTDIPENLDGQLRNLAKETSIAAIIHGIKTGAKKDSRNFRYIAECARNYVPSINRNRYHVEVPGIVALTPANSHAPSPLPPPVDSGDPWASALAELVNVLPGSAPRWLEGSRLEENGELAGEPLYRVVLIHPQANAQWLIQQAEPAVRKKLASLLRKRILIEFVREVDLVQGPTP
jgi:hypothetical protein